eukprot:TRINITY_DN6030_c0_g1_i1.p1 TRINITY_DN6030_c0_g1~~TRINITY_DN6030_c0_g1_i1.p1  ORF type:complete len:121 (+),score=31.65 TRINITY_DN6030_c0_g1_i1:335-697(+)
MNSDFDFDIFEEQSQELRRPFSGTNVKELENSGRVGKTSILYFFQTYDHNQESIKEKLIELSKNEKFKVAAANCNLHSGVCRSFKITKTPKLYVMGKGKLVELGLDSLVEEIADAFIKIM